MSSQPLNALFCVERVILCSVTLDSSKHFFAALDIWRLTTANSVCPCEVQVTLVCVCVEWKPTHGSSGSSTTTSYLISSFQPKSALVGVVCVYVCVWRGGKLKTKLLKCFTFLTMLVLIHPPSKSNFLAFQLNCSNFNLREPLGTFRT